MPSNSLACLMAPPRSSAKETSRRKKLSEKIERLGGIEHGEIFRKLKMHNLGYTQNSNGIFFDITDIPGDIVDELTLFVDHCIENQTMLTTSRQNQFKLSSGKTKASNNNGSGDDAETSLSEEVSVELEDLGDADSNIPIEDPEPFRDDSKATESIPLKKPSSKFQHTRKKYSRPVASKTIYVNELRKE